MLPQSALSCRLPMHCWPTTVPGAAIMAEMRTQIAREHGEGLPHWCLPDKHELSSITQHAARMRHQASSLLVLTTGGSAMGIGVWAAFTHGQVRVADTVEPELLYAAFAASEPRDTHYLIISKSGSTLETLCQALALLDWLKQEGHEALITRQVTVLTLPSDRPLRQLAQAHGIRVLDHHPALGGRFSLLGMPGLLPAAFAGLPVEEAMAGAAHEFRVHAASEDGGAWQGAAWQAAWGMANRGVHVQLRYGEALAGLSAWWQLACAETLGKDGHGLTAMLARGPLDQHSQLQRWLGGKQDMCVTILSVASNGGGDPLRPEGLHGHNYLRAASLSDVFAAMHQATAACLRDEGVPCRELQVAKLDPYHLGAIVMFMVLENVATARLLGVNPYTQPAVEACKQRARALLKEQA